MAESICCRRYLVSGRVQGVWFRASTRDQALRLGLTGRADNLPDGQVEVVACGPGSALDALEAWLWLGPELAVVESVIAMAADQVAYDGFTTGRRPG
jgi:acylphosphatase